jgi:predicted dinucleotide-binding enzyme
VVLFAPRFEHVDAARKSAGSLACKVVIDATNPYNPARDGLVDLAGQTAAQFVSAHVLGARPVSRRAPPETVLSASAWRQACP